LAGFVNNFKHMVGLAAAQLQQRYDDEDIYDELYESSEEENEEVETYQENPIKNRKNNLRVLPTPNASNYEVMVIEPKTFEDSLEVVNNLRTKKSLILNLHLLDAEQSQRVVDFISGATHAIDGHQQKVGDGVFVFTPNNVNIAVETEKTRVMRDAFWNQV
jgi:cell division inhibitor SepF